MIPNLKSTITFSNTKYVICISIIPTVTQAGVAQLIGALSHEPKGHESDSQSRAHA